MVTLDAHSLSPKPLPLSPPYRPPPAPLSPSLPPPPPLPLPPPSPPPPFPLVFSLGWYLQPTLSPFPPSSPLPLVLPPGEALISGYCAMGLDDLWRPDLRAKIEASIRDVAAGRLRKEQVGGGGGGRWGAGRGG